MLPIKAILNSIKASFSMEGMHATETDEKNITDVLTGKRRLEDVIEEIKQKHVESTEDSIE